MGESDGIVRPVTSADFDADGDGHVDLLVYVRTELRALAYGPIAPGPHVLLSMDSGVEVPEGYSYFGDALGCTASRESDIILDHLGPGRHAALVGRDAYSCPVDGRVFDISVPRGTWVDDDADALAEVDASRSRKTAFRTMGDVDGDGIGDGIIDVNLGSTACIRKGPISKTIDFLLCNDEGYALVEVGTSSFGGDFGLETEVADVNGDSIQDLLAYNNLILSPFADPISDDVICDLDFVGVPGRIPWPGKWADIDGDGRGDFVYFGETCNEITPEDERCRFLLIWYGKGMMAFADSLGAEPF